MQYMEVFHRPGCLWKQKYEETFLQITSLYQEATKICGRSHFNETVFPSHLLVSPWPNKMALIHRPGCLHTPNTMSSYEWI